eukprot:COSAG01_NODE_45009_length_413_cov_1.652866_1_plen_21_part_10
MPMHVPCQAQQSVLPADRLRL